MTRGGHGRDIDSSLAQVVAGAASVGLMLGALSACSGQPEPKTGASADPHALAEKACCKGLNECAGKGSCAVEGKNACAGMNSCRHQGGCNAHCPQ